MKKLILLFLTLTTSSLCGFGQKIVLTKLNITKIPPQIKYEGKIKGAYQFIDSVGKHIVITSETGVYTSKTKSQDFFKNAKLFAYHYLENQGKRILTWKVYDAILNCGVDVETSFVRNSFQLTDLNEDGKAEIWMVYKLGCFGGVDPHVMKIIMYEGEQKFAMRGETTVDIKNTKPYVGGYTFDRNFLGGPKVFTGYAKKLWALYSVDKYQ